MAFLVESLTDKARNDAVGKLEAVAKDLGCTVAQLAIAWCAKNPHVSTVITGASRPEQVRENMKAAEVIAKLDDAAMKRIEALTRPLSDL
jgi:aryl-alcohol dehydrogenase-like predicted oxidoreductase